MIPMGLFSETQMHTMPCVRARAPVSFFGEGRKGKSGCCCTPFTALQECRRLKRFTSPPAPLSGFNWSHCVTAGVSEATAFHSGVAGPQQPLAPHLALEALHFQQVLAGGRLAFLDPLVDAGREPRRGGKVYRKTRRPLGVCTSSVLFPFPNCSTGFLNRVRWAEVPCCRREHTKAR